MGLEGLERILVFARFNALKVYMFTFSGSHCLYFALKSSRELLTSFQIFNYLV